MACAWLIRRYIDPKASFAFVDRPTDADVPFDMYDGEFSHQGSECTFETLIQRFGLHDPVVLRLGRIVHDVDIKDARYGLPESVAVAHMVEGLRQLYADDHALLAQGIGMFEALARSFESPARDTRRPLRVRHTQKKR
jgi:hypothetical protein